MNRRTAMKLLLAPALLGVVPAVAKPQKPEDWTNCLLYKPRVMFEYSVYSYETEIVKVASFGNISLQINNSKIIMYAGLTEKDMRQIIGVTKLPNGSLVIRRGFRKYEIPLQDPSAIRAYCEQAEEDMRKCNEMA